MAKFCFICSCNDKMIHSNINFKHVFHKKCLRKWIRNEEGISEKVFTSALNAHDLEYLLKVVVKDGGRHDLLIALHQRGVNLGCVFKNGGTPILEAAKRGHADFVKYLVKNGIKCTDLDLNWFTWLNSETLLILIQNGAITDTKDHLGRTVLHKSCARGFKDVVLVLLDEKTIMFKKFDVNSKDYKGLTPLNYACQRKHVEIVKILIQKGADQNVILENISMLFGANSDGVCEILQILQENGAVLGQYDKFGKTALHYAALYGFIDVIQYLAEHYTTDPTAETKYKTLHIDERDTVKNTALHYACKGGQLDVVKYLVELGADVNAIGDDGKRPISLAKNKPQIVKYLKEHGAIPFSAVETIFIFGYEFEYTWHNFIRSLILFIALFLLFGVLVHIFMALVVFIIIIIFPSWAIVIK